MTTPIAEVILLFFSLMNYFSDEDKKIIPKNKNLFLGITCTQDNTILELFYKDLHLLYDLKNTLEYEGIDNYMINSSISDIKKTNSLLQRGD